MRCRRITAACSPVRRMRGAGGEREWWELNEQGTILHGESPGSTLRLGDPIEVRVARVDVARGRVDLIGRLTGGLSEVAKDPCSLAPGGPLCRRRGQNG